MNKFSYHPYPDGTVGVFDNGRALGRIQATPDIAALASLQIWSRAPAPTIILSAERSELTKSRNKVRHARLLNKLESLGIPHKSARGRYNGESERVIITRIDKPEHRRNVRALARDFNQETTLYITPERSVILQSASGNHVASLGQLKAVSRKAAKLRGSYTRANGCYYVTERDA